MFEKMTNWWNGTKQAAQEAVVDAAKNKAEDVAANSAAEAIKPVADKAESGIRSFLASVKTKAEANPVEAFLACSAMAIGSIYLLGKQNETVREYSKSAINFIFNSGSKLFAKLLESISKRAGDAAKELA